MSSVKAGAFDVGPLPFETDYNDHFQTPFIAYQHLAPVLLAAFGEAACDDSQKYTIYDPYYCTGSVPKLVYRSLVSAGDGGQHSEVNHPPPFRNAAAVAQRIAVVNAPRDFYADIASGAVPACDFIVTNPPYSGDHKIRCFRYLVDRLTGSSSYTAGAASSSSSSSSSALHAPPQPPIDGYAVLLPSYCAGKSYYSSLMVQSRMRPPPPPERQSAAASPASDFIELFLIPPPSLRYAYDHPEGLYFIAVWLITLCLYTYNAFESYFYFDYLAFFVISRMPETGTGKAAPPFFSVWYIGVRRALLGAVRQRVRDYNASARRTGDHQIRLVEDFYELKALSSGGSGGGTAAATQAQSNRVHPASATASAHRSHASAFSQSQQHRGASSASAAAAAVNLSRASEGGGFGFGKRKNPKARRKERERMAAAAAAASSSGASSQPRRGDDGQSDSKRRRF
jgi:hypothetical protein